MVSIFSDVLVFLSMKDIIIPEEVRMIYPPPLYGVKHLLIDVPAENTPVELLESLLWLAPCPESINIHHPFTWPSFCKVFKVLKSQAYSMCVEQQRRFFTCKLLLILISYVMHVPFLSPLFFLYFSITIKSLLSLSVRTLLLMKL